MSVVDSIFVAVSETPSQVATWLVQVDSGEVMASGQDLVRLRRRGATIDEWLGVVVQPNGYADVNPEPDDVQAMDAYGIEIQLRGGRTDEILHTESGQLFDKLVAARSDLPMLLVHNLETLVTAYLPGVGTHTFEPLISPDAADLTTWRPWVAGLRPAG